MPSTIQRFDELYEEFYLQLFKAACQMTADIHFAEDLTQSAFTTLYEKRDEVFGDPNINIKGWLVVTLRNKYTSEMKRASRDREIPLNDQIDFSQSAEMPIAFQDILPNMLSEEERRVLCLYYEEECSHNEIGQRMGCSAAASRMRVHRALTRCREFAKKEKF